MADHNATTQKLITELKASAHLMMLDTGLFCIFHIPGGRAPDARSGLPGVRLSQAPGDPAGRTGKVQISTFHEDGWIGGTDGAALVRVEQGPAQILVTVYQTPEGAHEAPKLQVMRLSEETQGGAQAPAPSASPPAASDSVEIIAHIYGRGDVGGRFGEWVGERGGKRWIEGFAIVPPAGIPASDLEYQAVLGRDWLSPWTEGGQFCGSRGMSLPILGLRARLRGKTAGTHALTVSASFVDGTSAGPAPAEDGCQSDSYSPLEAIQLEMQPRAASARGKRQESVRKPAKPAPVAAATRPAPAKAAAPPSAKVPAASRAAAKPQAKIPPKPMPAAKGKPTSKRR